MKKTLLLAIVTSNIFLAGCGTANEVTTTTEATTETTSLINMTTESTTQVTTIPVTTENTTEKVTYDDTVFYSDIKAGKYSDLIVPIKCLVDNVNFSELSNSIDFDAWILDNNSNYLPEKHCCIDLDDNFEGNNELKNLKNGDYIQLRLKIYSDNSIGFNEIYYAEFLTPEITLDTVKLNYKQQCQSIPLENILRTPDQYFYQNVTYSGSVFQIVDETESGYTEFLLDTGTENGMIDVVYSRPQSAPRILENDSVTIYGQSYKLHNYNSVLGDKKTVPRIGAIIIE